MLRAAGPALEAGAGPAALRSCVRAPGPLPRGSASASPPLPGAVPASATGLRSHRRLQQTLNKNHKCISSAAGVGTPRSARERVCAALWLRQARMKYRCGGAVPLPSWPGCCYRSRSAANGPKRARCCRAKAPGCGFLEFFFCRFILFFPV